MRRLIIAIGLSCLATAAAAQSATTRALREAAFAGPAPTVTVDKVVEKPLARNGRVFIFAGAAAPEGRLQGDPRWTPQNDAAAGAHLVDTKVGVGWRRDGLQTSFGYMRRQVTDAPMIYGDAPRRDSMLGFSVSLRR